MAYVLVVGATLLSSSAHIFLKRYALAKNAGTAAGFLDHRFLCGMGLFGSSVLCGVVALLFLEFSKFYAVTALNFLFISVFSYCFLGETMDRFKVVGNMVIIIGVLVYCL